MTLRTVPRKNEPKEEPKEDRFFWDESNMPEVIDWGPKASAQDGKVSQKDAGYKDGLPQAHCSICKHFEAPSKCEVVEGTIKPEDWCKLFDRKW